MTPADTSPSPTRPDHPRTAEAGEYVVVRAGDLTRGEWTNIGVIFFGSDGRQTFARFDTARAIQRGDMPDDDFTRQYVADYAASVPTVEEVERRLGSSGHAMSMIQMTEPNVYLCGYEDAVVASKLGAA